MMTYIGVNIGSGNGMFPDGTKSLPEPMLIYHLWSFVAFAIHKSQINNPEKYAEIDRKNPQ